MGPYPQSLAAAPVRSGGCIISSTRRQSQLHRKLAYKHRIQISHFGPQIRYRRVDGHEFGLLLTITLTRRSSVAVGHEDGERASEGHVLPDDF